jgi:ABC-type oligopeptide transport system ATPase subunit
MLTLLRGRTMSEPLVRVDGLVKHFRRGAGNILLREKPVVCAVDGVSFTIGAGETLCLVGESGCGKSTVGRLVLRLIEPTAGRVAFDGADLVSLAAERLRRMRSR